MFKVENKKYPCVKFGKDYVPAVKVKVRGDHTSPVSIEIESYVYGLDIVNKPARISMYTGNKIREIGQTIASIKMVPDLSEKYKFDPFEKFSCVQIPMFDLVEINFEGKELFVIMSGQENHEELSQTIPWACPVDELTPAPTTKKMHKLKNKKGESQKKVV